MKKEVISPLDFRASVLMSHNVSTSDERIYRRHIQSRGVFKRDEVSLMYPVDIRFGLPSTDLGRLANPMLSNYEKEKVMSRLSAMGVEKGTYLPSGLSDDEIYSLLPPRYYSQDPVDVQKWRDYLGKEILPNMKDVAIEVADDTPDVTPDVKQFNED